MARPIDADALIKRFTEIKESGVSLRDAVYLDGVMAIQAHPHPAERVGERGGEDAGG